MNGLFLFGCIGGKELKHPIIVQPEKCRGCVWGTWRETKQYCSRPICVKEIDSVALKRFCRKQGCSNLTDVGYCEQHTAEGYKYDQYRGTAAERGYGPRWRRERLLFLKQHPLCECTECKATGAIEAATVVDHIVPHKGNYNLFWNKDNWQAMTKQHHDRKTASEDGGFGR